jgi:hypothetical protein
VRAFVMQCIVTHSSFELIKLLLVADLVQQARSIAADRREYWR